MRVITKSGTISRIEDIFSGENSRRGVTENDNHEELDEELERLREELEDRR